MQVRRQYLPNPSKYNHLFSKTQKQNRVELVSDFPKGNDAEVISSLQVSRKLFSVVSSILLNLRHSITDPPIRLVCPLKEQ